MSEVTKETLKKAYKPFDLVSDKNGNVGIIQEVDVNDCQEEPEHQISYAVEWLIGRGDKHAWYSTDELTSHCNLFVRIAECACHPMGSSSTSVKSLFNNMELS